MVVLRAQVGVQERRYATKPYYRNSGIMVERYLQSVYLGPGHPWCIAVDYYVWLIAAQWDRSRVPFLCTGSTQRAYNDARKRGLLTPWNLKRGDILIWQNQDLITGHADAIDSVFPGGLVRVIAGNISNGKNGSQREGHGVFVRYRYTLHPLERMRLRGAIGFKEPQ